MIRLHPKDTSQDGEHTTNSNGDHAHRDSEGLEEELKLLIGEFGAEVVHKRMNLAQPKHTESLQIGRGETFSCGIVVLISATLGEECVHGGWGEKRSDREAIE